MTCETIGKTKQKNCKLKQCQMSQSAICSCLFTSTLNVDIIAKGKKCKIKQKINFSIFQFLKSYLVYIYNYKKQIC